MNAPPPETPLLAHGPPDLPDEGEVHGVVGPFSRFQAFPPPRDLARFTPPCPVRVPRRPRASIRRARRARRITLTPNFRLPQAGPLGYFPL
ncbi:MAG: hypothetical protein M5U12_22035 [Verrucomicrobia bacterium]|nr:hypothetical protein [Verrucomicrobiota bacterium]